jgi:hypothetical protein
MHIEIFDHLINSFSKRLVRLVYLVVCAYYCSLLDIWVIYLDYVVLGLLVRTIIYNVLLKLTLFFESNVG